MRSLIAVLALILAFLIPVATVEAQFITEDLGECAFGVFEGYAAHEWGHDLAAVAVGERPWRPFVLWGDKWNESQKGYRTNALGGFVGQHLYSAINIAISPDTFARCANYGDAFISLVYALRARLFPNDAGDYDPFSIAKRNQITFVNIMTPTPLRILADQMAADESWRKAHSPLFRSPLGQR